MDAIKMLIEQHRRVETLFKAIEKALEKDETAAQARELFTELADNLAAHAIIEETIFYPQVLANQTKEMLHEAVEEHLSVKRILADLLRSRTGAEEFRAKIKVLKEQVQHHVDDEEGEMLPKVKKLLPKDQLEELGDEMEAQFAELMEGEPRLDVPSETSAPAPLA